MDDALRKRVEALERAVTDGEHDLSAFADDAGAIERLDTLEADVEDLAGRVEELEAATQALRGYVGNIRSVNTEVEQRADAALAKAEALECRLPETTATTDRQPSTADDTPDGGDHSAGTGDPGGDDGHAVDEWEWGTSSHTSGTAATRGDNSGAHPRGDNSGAHPRGDGSRATPTENRTGTPGDRSGSPEGHSGRAGRGNQAGRCGSCGRPHAESLDHATVGQTTAGQAPDNADTTPGAPTVTAIAEDEPAGPDDAPVDDGDVLPDGAEEPLAGPGDNDGGPGTIQRIRDLL
ncbi:hypothetical protein BRC61_06540 [Halobacteriales archaeon QH_10_65_19]|nr:MAG: hypothetical protein BRC61_06540 [Halobacteriales archaeon QH_10_65_19]